MNLRVKIKRLHPDAIIPQYAREGDAGFDLVAVEDTIIEPGETKIVPTGIAISLPPGYEATVRPRSGITVKTKLRVQLGTIDQGYVGEIGVIVDNVTQPLMQTWFSEADGYVTTPESNGYLLTVESDLEKVFYEGADETTQPLEMGWWRPNGTYIVRKGDRIAQAVIAPVAHATFAEVDELGETERGANGYGSSGVKHAE